jgi:quinol monooxygenase YgiN
MVLVTATVQARADSIDELRRLCLEHVARSRAEPGCLEHGVSIDANDGLRLVFVERWSDREALALHAALPTSRAFGKALARLAAQPPTLHAYEAEETVFPGVPPRVGAQRL